MHLTVHFTIEELCRSEYATRHCLGNTPKDEEILANLNILASGLERVRSKIGRVIYVLSGYRSPKVNSGVGGAKESRHLRGLAADIVVPGMSSRELAFLIDNWKHVILFRKLILEGTWVHIDFPDVDETPKGDVYTAHFNKDGVTYTAGLE